MMIGITGGISSGKTVVSEYLEKKGFNVIYADRLAQKELEDPAVINALLKRFGSAILTENSIDRRRLGEIIFGNDSDRLYLNDIIHPRVIEKIKQIHPGEEIIFVEVPLLYEAGMAGIFNKIIVVYADRQTMLDRLMKRDKINLHYALKKVNSQMDIKEKRKLADFVIDNSRDVDHTYAQVEYILKRLSDPGT